MDMAIWIGLAVLATVGFCVLVISWQRRALRDSLPTPSEPPAGPGAEGMRVTTPGDISPGVPDRDHD